MNVLNGDQFKKEISGKTPILIDFYADWCGPCKMLSPILDDLSKDKDFEGKLKFGKLNTEDYPELAAENSVSGIPCLIIFKNNKEVSRIVGYAPKPIIKAKISSELGKL